MLMAQLKGKLTREEEGLEDLLTSNVFGSFKYASPGEGLVPFLACAVQDDGKTKPLENLSSIETYSYDFWPSYVAADSKRCEPDLLITIGDENETRLLIMIEAKYRSPKSGFPSDEGKLTDQLAKEWDVLEKMAGGDIKAFLVFVTADYVMPRGSIEESQEELKRKRGKKGNILWLSWRELPSILEGTEHPILRDLFHVVKKYGLNFFEGVSLKDDCLLSSTWTFTKGPEHFQWTCQPQEASWCFLPKRGFAWGVSHYRTEWGFAK